MATRSLIGIKTGDTVKTIYCHWDGYPSHNGIILVDNYNTPSKIYELLVLGDLSTLKETIDTCWAYHRDRKESYDKVKAKDIKYSDLEKYANDYGVDYIYVYNEEFEWECFKYNPASGNYSTTVNILSERVFTEALN
jgi:hypothetical protein